MTKPLQILCICCLYFIQKTNAQDFPDIKFSLLNTANGLPTNLITSAFKDSRGFLWVGTENNGLLRYDGKKIKTFQGGNTSVTVITANYVNTICEDKNGWIWISTGEGLYHLDPVTELSEHYTHDDKDETSIGSNDKPKPFVDSEGRVWVTSTNGLQQFNPVIKKFIHYSSPPITNPAWQSQAKNVGIMMEDSRHRLWAASAYGLYLADTISHSLKAYFTGIYSWVSGIVEDEKQEIWVSFWGAGIKMFDPVTGHFKDVYKPSGIARCLNKWRDENNKQWLCFEDNSFILIDPVTKKYKPYPPGIIKTNSLKGIAVSCIYTDNENRIWICTNTGVQVVDKKLQQFTNHLLYLDIAKDSINTFGEPKALLVRQNDYLLSTWFWGSLYRYEKNWKLKEIIKKIPPASVSGLSKVINTIQQDGQGNTWYGTDSGLVKKTGNTFKTYLPADSFLLLENKYAARNILLRSDGLYWARFLSRGVYLFDPAKGNFLKNYRSQFQGDALCMEYDRKGNLWLGSTRGLYVYKSSSDSFVQIPVKHPEIISQQHYNYVYQIFFDEQNIGWIGTYNGLVRVNPEINKTNIISDPLKPQYYLVWRLLQDTSGTLWMLSNSGLVACNKYTKAFRYFTTENGLPENFVGFPGVFNWLDDSTIAVGSTGTVTTFNPYHIVSLIKGTSILFTDVYGDGTRIPVINAQKKIVIPAGTKVLNIHFAFLNYTAPQQNKLYYRVISGKNEAWIETDNGDIILLNLNPGSYVLQVKGECNSNISNISSAEIIIEMQPFWYQSLLFKIIFLAILVVLIYFFITWRIRLVKTAAALKQQITETEMAALKAQMNPHFIFNCISSIDGLIQGNDKYNATVYLNKFAKLIRNILDSSKEKTVEFAKDIETLQLYIDLEKLRDESKYITELNVSAELLESDYQVPPLVIQPFVENAIHHGLRNRRDDNGILTIRVVRMEDDICYNIIDNGVGRSATAGLNRHNHQSYGVEMSTERIRLFNDETVSSVKIEDLYENGQPAGTCVTVKLKIK